MTDKLQEWLQKLRSEVHLIGILISVEREVEVFEARRGLFLA